MDDSAELAKMKRRLQTVESQLADLSERLSAYESGSDKNPNTALYLSDGRGGKVAKIDYDAESDDIRVTKVR